MLDMFSKNNNIRIIRFFQQEYISYTLNLSLLIFIRAEGLNMASNNFRQISKVEKIKGLMTTVGSAT